MRLICTFLDLLSQELSKPNILKLMLYRNETTKGPYSQKGPSNSKILVCTKY